MVIVRRLFEEKQTLGDGEVFMGTKSIFGFKTLELPWLNNQQQVSCIPEGEYEVVKRHSPKYKNHFHVTEVPGRSWILIHSGNFYSDILGCILPGNAFRDINKDGLLDVISSATVMKLLNDLMPAKFKLTITKVK